MGQRSQHALFAMKKDAQVFEKSADRQTRVAQIDAAGGGLATVENHYFRFDLTDSHAMLLAPLIHQVQQEL
jgi:hypothetical protein